ncbi:MAG: hypothetical protein MK101_03175 [Phycisphaerales bacterium]|nr:hypothetical protein [Phycisphaerales bacterium]
MISTALYAVGIPLAVSGGVLATTLLVPRLRTRGALIDGTLAACLAGAAMLSFVLEKGMQIPHSDEWQKWLITSWVLLIAAGAGMLASWASTIRIAPLGGWVIAAGLGASAAIWLELPGLDTAGDRVTFGLMLGLTVLVVQQAVATGRELIFCIGLWAIGASLSLTLLEGGNLTLPPVAGALSATAAAAAVLLAITSGGAPARRVGVGTATAAGTAFVFLIVLGQKYDYSVDGIADWRWWLPLTGLGALLLLPAAVHKSSSKRRAPWLMPLMLVVLPSVPSIILALKALATASPDGY